VRLESTWTDVTDPLIFHFMEAHGTPEAHTLTVEEFERLPDEDLYRIELVRGTIVREPRPGGEHGLISSELFSRLDRHVRAAGLGRVLVETGFRLPGSPATVRGPDVAFLARERLPARAPRSFWEGAPDLAVEVISPSDRWTRVQDKAFDYLDAGAREVWVVDPLARRVTVYRSRTESVVLGADSTLSGGTLLPGFELRLSELFSGL
jgi:Uma2 family endonuclease